MSIINTADIGKLKKNKVNKAGDTMTGLLTLSGDPTSNLQAATKQYVDSVQNTFDASFSKVGNDITINGNLIPDGDDTRSLGSATKAFKDLYIGPGSLYVNGQKVIHDTTGTLIISADPNQNIDIQTQGTGDLSFSPAIGNAIELNGTVQVMAGMNVVSSDGNNISFSNGFDMNNEEIINLIDPTTNQGAATKKFVDDSISALSTVYVDVTGDTMTGQLSCPVLDTNSLSVDNGNTVIDSGIMTVSNAITTIDSWATTEFQSAKYTVTARGNGNKFQVSEILLFHDNANVAYLTEYGIMSSDGTPFVTYEVDVNAGNVRLRATLDAAWSGGHNIKFTRFAQDII